MLAADAADVAPQIVGSLAATIAVAAAAGPSGAGLPLLALAAAGGGVLTSAVTDALVQANLDVGTIKEIVDRRGFEGVLDFAFGLTTGGTSKLLTTRLAKEVAEDVPTKPGLAAAVKNIESETGINVPLTVGEITQNPTLQRIESIGEKLPLSSEVFRKAAIERDAAVDLVQKRITGRDFDVGPQVEDATRIGSDFADEFTRARNRARFDAEDLRARIDANLQTNLDTIGDSLGPGGRGVTTTDSGETFRAAATLRRDSFLDQVRANYEAVRNAPGGREAIVDPQGINRVAARIEREVPQERIMREVEVFEDAPGSLDDLPLSPQVSTATEQTGTRPARAFIPSNVRRFLDSIRNLDNMTIDQAREGRRLIFDAIAQSEALPGINTRFLRMIGNEFSEAMRQAANDLPDGRLRRFLTQANDHYRENFEDYLRPGIVEAYRNPTEAGFVEDSALVERVIGSPERLGRIRDFLGADSREWGVFRRSIYNNILDESRSILKPNNLDLNRLANQVSRMNPETRTLLFGQQAENLENTIRLIAANSGDIPLSAIDNLSGGMAQAIRTAAIRERTLAREYNDRVFKPFLRDELGATEMSPDKFTRYVMTEAEVDELDKAFVILGRNNPQRDKFERAVIMDILDKGTVPATADDIVSGSINEGDNIIKGSALFKALKNGYGPRTDEKLVKVLGPQKLRLLRDLATIQASKEQKSKSAAGGLISGFVISSMARGDLSALPMLAQYKVLSWMMTDKTMSKLMMSKSFPVKSKQGKANKVASVMTGTMINDLSKFVGPEDMTAVLDFFNIPAERRPPKPSATEFLELNLNQSGRTTKPDIRLQVQ